MVGVIDRRELAFEAAALLVAAGLQILLPESMTAGPSWLIVAAVAVLSVASAITHGPVHRTISHATSAIVTGAVAYSLAELIQSLFAHHGTSVEVLRGAVLLWTSNVLVFATWYYRLDAGGPHIRGARRTHDAGAFLFPQMTMSPDERKAHGLDHWHPRFIDYLFIAFNTSTAFSPTDVPVLSPWAKALMMVQSSIALATVAVLAARAINIL